MHFCTKLYEIVHLSRAVQLAKDGVYTRPFLNEQKLLTPLFESTLTYMEQEQNPEVSRKFLQELIVTKANQKPIPGEAEGFSAREIQILSELSQGQPDKLIARQTGLSAHGVRYHLKNIYSKMGVENRLQAITRAQEMGLL